MGKNSTSSVNSSFVEGEKVYLGQKGKDTNGITECFQYHEKYLSKNEIKLTYVDKFYKEAFRPMP